MQYKRFFFLFIFVSSLFNSFLYAQTSDTEKLLRFKYKKGDSYRILSTVSEDVKVNGNLDHHAEIVNRISVQVNDVDAKGQGLNNVTFMTSEDAQSTQPGQNFTWGQEYQSTFWRDPLGVYTIDPKYFMPVVRDEPLFPEPMIHIGTTWEADGYEAHDLRRIFNINTPYKVPFTAHYEYLRDEEKKPDIKTADSKQQPQKLQVLSVNYKLYYKSPLPENVDDNSNYPVETMGFSNQTIWWDNEKGQIDHYAEDFRIIIETVRGDTFNFSGTAHAEVTDFKRTATEQTKTSVENKVKELGLSNVSVTNTDKGLTISIQNIQFSADSAELSETEKNKLIQIAAIIKELPDNDLLVTGHTAMAGNQEERQLLSEQRAASVANFLINLGIRDKYHIFTQGFGGKVPIATNETEEGKAKNRRVEITILDK